MAVLNYGLLGSASSAIRVAVQKPVYDFYHLMAEFPLFKMTEDVTQDAWYDHFSGYVAPAALDYGIGGGGVTLPTTGWLYP